MNKSAMTSVEVMIAMALVAAAALLSLNVLRVYINKDTDIVKFKHAFATLSEVVYFLKNDSTMYPKSGVVGGFNDLTSHQYINETIIYGGEDKFKKLFTSKYNVLENNINVNIGIDVPLIKYKHEDSNNSYINYEKSSTINCFIENKGFMICPPITTLDSKNRLLAIYVPVYINKIDDTPASTGIEKAIFVEIANDGKVEIPPIIENYPSQPVIDCTNKEYNSYSHCKILDKMMDMDF